MINLIMLRGGVNLVDVWLRDSLKLKLLVRVKQVNCENILWPSKLMLE